MRSDSSPPHIEVLDLEMAYGSFVVMRGISLQIQRGEIFVVMGGSGCGKSTLMRHLIGLQRPAGGDIRIAGQSLVHAGPEVMESIKRRFGVLFQGGALWSSMTLAENIALPLQSYTNLTDRQIDALVRYKLALVGLRGFEGFYPSEISGGMRKRAGLARAMALDPEILFFDEPSSGLDPLSSRRLDDLILELRDTMGTTVVVVTHELASIFAVGDKAVFLDARRKTMGAIGDPRKLRDCTDDPALYEFLSRGEPAPASSRNAGDHNDHDQSS